MKILLDTNILIHREASKVINEEIGHLFHWMDQLHYEKCVHPLSLIELEKHSDANVVKPFALNCKATTKLKH